MSGIAFPVLYTLAVWWASTGLILYLDSLPRHTYRWSMTVASALLAAALYGLATTRSDTSTAGAYGAFTCAIVIWGWLEMTFLMGYVTGPRRAAHPAGGDEWQRFCGALQSILYHEFALVVLGVVVLSIAWGERNDLGARTFLILWAMRLSAKLNLFLGVRNLGEEMLPANLQYLATYFARRPMNLLFPVSVTAATVVAAFVWERAFQSEANVFEITTATFAGTLLTLAIVEHWFLILPLPANALWTWGSRSRDRSPTAIGTVTSSLVPAVLPDKK